jgi:TolB-like protein/DNA-binding winged helix-turn-helix (wHTH) protein
MQEPWVFRFGEFSFDQRTGVVRTAAGPLQLQPRPSRVLRELLLRKGELVSREELQRLVWRDGTPAELDQRLNFCIKQVRTALGDRAGAPRFVETLPRRGYRFVAPLEPIAAPEPRATQGRRLAPLAAALLSAALLGPPQPPSPNPARTLVAVLPFESAPGAEQEAFSDGLTEETINGLGRLSPERLGVIARSSAMPYKGAAKPLPQVGRELGVSHVVEGSVCRAGLRVRVAAKLVRVGDQSQLWAETYELPGDDPLQLQNLVAARIASSLRARLVAAPAAAAGTTPRPSEPAETVGA